MITDHILKRIFREIAQEISDEYKINILPDDVEFVVDSQSRVMRWAMDNGYNMIIKYIGVFRKKMPKRTSVTVNVREVKAVRKRYIKSPNEVKIVLKSGLIITRC